MTALKQYDRLESGGLWRPDPEAQRRDVTVSFGDATLVITDAAGRPLTHWSLAAVERQNPGAHPAIFTPDLDATETLEIDDTLMIDAIETVRKVLAKARPRQGKLRLWITLAAVAVAIGLGTLWLPGALRDQAASVVPQVKRIEIGATILVHLQRLTGPACRGEMGTAALERLQTRLLGPNSPGQIVVMPLGKEGSIALPGGIVLLDQSLVQDVDDPMIPAGYVLAAYADSRLRDPISAILAQAPLSVTARLLTTSILPSEVLRSHAQGLLASPPAAAPLSELRIAFDQADVPSTPYAMERARRGQPLPALIAEDPLAGRTSQPVLTDLDWVALQGICDL